MTIYLIGNLDFEIFAYTSNKQACREDGNRQGKTENKV